MKRTRARCRILWIALHVSVFLPWADESWATGVPGVDWYVGSARIVEIVRAQTVEEAALFPPPAGEQRVIVEHVLKGVDTSQEFLVRAGVLQPGARGIILDPQTYNPIIWPMDAHGMVNMGTLHQHTESGFMPLRPGEQQEDTVLPWEIIKEQIIARSPDEYGTNALVVEALVRPEKFKEFAAKNAERATYVRFFITIRDLERSIPELSRLLELPDKEGRAAAEARLKKLTGADVPPPKDESPSSLHAWAEAWEKQNLTVQPLTWPPLPPDLKTSPDAFPEPLVKAVREEDAEAFEKEFPRWLDSGVMRDRQILMAKTSGGMKDISLAKALKVETPGDLRMNRIALIAEASHHSRFVSEQKQRAAFIEKQKPDAEVVKRAFIWEPSRPTAVIEVNVRSTAWNKMQDASDHATVRFVETISFGASATGTKTTGKRVSIKNGNPEFAAASLQYLRTHRDAKAQEIADQMCQDKNPKVVPIVLEWLKDKDPKVRAAAARALCFFPSKDTAPALLAAIAKEPKEPAPAAKPADADENDAAEDDDGKPAPRTTMLIALAQTGDKRGLETLLAEARAPVHPTVQEEVVRGLGRIRDKKALPALAAIVHKLEWIEQEKIPENRREEADDNVSLLYEAANAFAYVLTGSGEYEPSEWLSSSGLDHEELKQEMALIKKWQKGNSK